MVPTRWILKILTVHLVRTSGLLKMQRHTLYSNVTTRLTSVDLSGISLELLNEI